LEEQGCLRSKVYEGASKENSKNILLLSRIIEIEINRDIKSTGGKTFASKIFIGILQIKKGH